MGIIRAGERLVKASSGSLFKKDGLKLAERIWVSIRVQKLGQELDFEVF